MINSNIDKIQNHTEDLKGTRYLDRIEVTLGCRKRKRNEGSHVMAEKSP